MTYGCYIFEDIQFRKALNSRRGHW